MLDESKWPFDPVGYVFLPRAINEAGEALFASEWTGKELAYGTGSVVFTSAFEMFDSLKALSEAHPMRQEVGSLLLHQNRFLNLWERVKARLEAHPEFEACASSATRLRKVQSLFIQALAAGALEGMMRPVLGGGVSPIPQEWWHSEAISGRFCSFQLDAWAPFGPARQRRDLQYIFVTRPSLKMVRAQIEVARSGKDVPLPSILVVPLAALAANGVAGKENNDHFAVKKRGRPPEWSIERLARLVAAVDDQKPGPRELTGAIRTVAELEEWQPAGGYPVKKKERAEAIKIRTKTLRAAYYKATGGSTSAPRERTRALPGWRLGSEN